MFALVVFVARGNVALSPVVVLFDLATYVVAKVLVTVVVAVAARGVAASVLGVVLVVHVVFDVVSRNL